MRKILMIPGPIEYESQVLNTMSLPTISHSSKEFISIYREALQNLMTIFGSSSTEGTPFIISGSGTLGMEASTVNFIKRNSKVLVVNTGYFGDRFVDLFSRFTDRIDQVKPSLGMQADPKLIEEKLETNEYDLMTVTHVDTSTGVRNDVKKIAEITKKRDTLLVVDAVCSAGGEKLDMKWGIDVAFSASQKALGAPPGLTVGVVGSRAASIMEKVPPMSFYSDLRKWAAVSKAMLDSRLGYFGTPNVNLISALAQSLRNIVSEGLNSRITRHEIMSTAIRGGITELGLEMIPKDSFANTISAIYLPKNVRQKEFLADAETNGAVFASGLIKEISERYFRIGHMGSIGSSEVVIAISAIERSLKKNGYDIELGKGIKAAQEILFGREIGS
jgi:alanine-glyoxylate transaminase/serine-glyoxylate transaminase/serine-pyruvate transaminase